MNDTTLHSLSFSAPTAAILQETQTTARAEATHRRRTTVTRSFTSHCIPASQRQLFTLEKKPCLHQKEALFVSKTSLVYNQKKPCLKTDNFPFVFSIHFHGKRVYLKKNFKLICIYRTLCVPLHRFYRATGCSAVG